LEKSWKDSVVHTPHYGDYGSIPSPQVVRRRSANHAYIFCSDLGDFKRILIWKLAPEGVCLQANQRDDNDESLLRQSLALTAYFFSLLLSPCAGL
jgi:hypothetical protein